MTQILETEKKYFRRLACVKITASSLMKILATAKARKISCVGLPVDAIPYRVSYDPISGAVLAFFEHDSFMPVEEGNCVPEIDVRFTEHFGDEP